MKKLSLLLAFLLAGPVFAQTTPPTPPTTLPGWNVAINGSFSSDNGSTNNGFALTEELRVAPHWAIRADEYLLNNPNTTVALAGVEYRLPGTSIFKSTSFAANASKLELFANAEAGDAHATVADTASVVKRHFAVGVGGGFDIIMSPTVSLRVLDLKYVNGGIMTGGGKVLGNGLSLGAGIGIRF